MKQRKRVSGGSAEQWRCLVRRTDSATPGRNTNCRASRLLTQSGERWKGRVGGRRRWREEEDESDKRLREEAEKKKIDWERCCGQAAGRVDGYLWVQQYLE